MELIQWEGLEGRDLSERAIPPNLGHMALRWAVTDVKASAKRITDTGHALFANIQPVTLHPYGTVQLCSVRTPDGVVYDLFQPQ